MFFLLIRVIREIRVRKDITAVSAPSARPFS